MVIPYNLSMTLLTTERLRIRHLTADDYDVMYAVYSDPAATRYVDDGSPITPEDTARWIDVTLKNYEKYGYGMEAIELIESGEVIGFIGLMHYGGDPLPEVKYSFLSTHWGKGYATEAVRGLIDYSRTTFNLDEVVATVSSEHTASQNVLRKCGLNFLQAITEDDGSVTHVYTTHPDNSAYVAD